MWSDHIDTACSTIRTPPRPLETANMKKTTVQVTGSKISPTIIKKSTTQRGNDFRDAVAALLRTKHDSVEIEKTIGGKNVDIVYTEQRYGRAERVAVECKDYSQPLTATIITREILGDYRDILSAREIDYLLIIGRHPIGGAAKARIDAVRNVSYLTYEELEEDLLGLRGYVEGLRDMFSVKGLESYYIEAKFDGDEISAYESMQRWLKDEGSPPLAILGGYGQGKTSLATRVVAAQARAHLADPTQRMPILIRLGEIVHETTLEGLFGKEFTSRFRSKYHFDIFRHLNDSGRLLIVLDGFDEMKHGMKASDFRANFAEFNRLLVPKSKVVLLGRPSAFSSDMRRLVFGGRKKVGETEIVVPNMTPWVEKQISCFSADETKTFLKGYITHLILRNRSNNKFLSEAEVDARIREIMSDVDLELIARPLHARIIAELAVAPEVKFKGFNEYDLYSQFIQQILERDAELKSARKNVPIRDRMRFQERLAYWAWTRSNQSQGNFLREEIPISLLDDLHYGNTDDDEGRLFEYIVSTVTDAKESGHLYFAHRSFQEFLVAEFLKGQRSEDVNHERNSAAADDAVTLFLSGSRDTEFIERWYDSLPSCNAHLTTLYLGLFLEKESVVLQLRDKFRREDLPHVRDRDCEIALEDAALLGIAAIRRSSEMVFSEEEKKHFLRMMLVRSNRDVAALAYHFLLRLCATRVQFLELLYLVFNRRPEFRLQSLQRRDRVAHKLVLGEDWVAAATSPTLLWSEKARGPAVTWVPNRTYGNITRLIKLNLRIALEDAPSEVADASNRLYEIKLTKRDLENIEIDVDSLRPRQLERTDD